VKQYIRKRLLGFFVVLIGVSVLSFLLLTFSGNDPAETLTRRMDINASDEMIEATRVEMGLDKPLTVQYFSWIKGIFTGNVGISMYSMREIMQDMAEYFPVTFTLVGMAMLWVVFLGVPVSLLSARFRNGIADHLTRAITILGICMPTFWLGFLLLLAFAVNIPIFKVFPEPGMKGYILPSFALACPVICGTIRLFRSSLLSELSADYVRYARARGLSAGRILLRHVMHNALPPIITLFCQYLGGLIAGSAVVESVFSMKGIGTYLIACVLSADTRSVATCIVVIAIIFVLANLAGDVINRILCPWMVRESNV
jgi:ABC-type dipeptide/oligopeptide/nickel transport system permease component